jgi:diguanylate cyclase (GGDEF)-like protein
VKHKSARSQRKTGAFRPPQPKRLSGHIEKHAGIDAPDASKPRARAVAARLAAEVERLAAELQASRAHITELEARVDVDPLTETLNRRGFERELKRSLAYVKRYGVSAALVYLDLDEFKPVNDRHGHAAGDAVLKAIASALTRHVRASDVVARIGGDEFVVLLWNVSGAAAAAKAAAFEAAVYATPVRWGASTLVVGASAGVAFMGPLDTPAEVLARADAAMYARKAERRCVSSLSPRAGRGHRRPSAAVLLRKNADAKRRLW